jgi:hypothetical protein
MGILTPIIESATLAMFDARRLWCTNPQWDLTFVEPLVMFWT